MPRARSSRGFARAPSRRLTAWQLGPGGSDLPTMNRVAFSTNTAAIIGSGITPLIDNLTVIRLHGFLECSLTAANAQRSGFNFVAGIGIITSDAFSVGVTAAPNPFDDIDWPGWMWMAQWSMRTAVAGLAVGDPSVNPVQIPIESKSMRKLRLNEVLFLSVQSGETSTATADVAGITRVLVKLP